MQHPGSIRKRTNVCPHPTASEPPARLRGRWGENNDENKRKQLDSSQIDPQTTQSRHESGTPIEKMMGMRSGRFETKRAKASDRVGMILDDSR